MLYFIKDGTIHQYPPVWRCSETYENQVLRDTIPSDVEECPYCLGIWPADRD
ncbi:hypothetical protein [Geomesophilobacter sediminis]|uniref:Uncharacterized protein n=1 Tax=Geomesophilobacter sediminis TaxID=2798584 RepID=A0A8J7M155_9BACT|nr:hypothetical protein [Geomesophilobacter sediminis]MBJ6726717.1 hypothetical protein [Geomesophilobacter sediminis]